MKNKNYVSIVLALFFLSLTGCVQSSGSPSMAPNGAEWSPVEEIFIVENNKNIKSEDISAVCLREVMTTTYDSITLELTNHSDYPFYLTDTYNVYKKTEEEYRLIDPDSDGKTYFNDVVRLTIESGTAQKVFFHLFDLIPEGDSYIPAGEYKLEIPIFGEETITAEFKMVDDYISLDTGISLKLPQNKYLAKSDEAFFIRS